MQRIFNIQYLSFRALRMGGCYCSQRAPAPEAAAVVVTRVNNAFGSVTAVSVLNFTFGTEIRFCNFFATRNQLAGIICTTEHNSTG